jgi:HK97 gp10 family phage protein
MPVPKMRFKMLDDPIKRMESLKQGVRNQILRKAVRAGAKAPRELAKRLAPRDSGILARSMSVKIKTSKKKPDLTYAVVGPKRGIQTKKKAGAIQWARPSKYMHLVEYGTKAHSTKSGDTVGRTLKRKKGADKVIPHVQTGQKVKGAKANPFLEKAWRTTAMVAREDMRRVVEEEVAKKLAKRPKR